MGLVRIKRAVAKPVAAQFGCSQMHSFPRPWDAVDMTVAADYLNPDHWEIMDLPPVAVGPLDTAASYRVMAHAAGGTDANAISDLYLLQADSGGEKMLFDHPLDSRTPRPASAVVDDGR